MEVPNLSGLHLGGPGKHSRRVPSTDQSWYDWLFGGDSPPTPPKFKPLRKWTAFVPRGVNLDELTGYDRNEYVAQARVKGLLTNREWYSFVWSLWGGNMDKAQRALRRAAKDLDLKVPKPMTMEELVDSFE